MLAPAGTPAPIVAKLNQEMVKIIHSADFKKRMADLGAEAIGDTPDQMKQLIATDTERFAKLVKDAKVSLDF
ncbi:Tripartite tricarboxylate transporter family receptor [Mycobacteroides abscessus subsp. abscessus]|nr:Tripartite tricarboxylate transporter family receptor [Mycobacteroides abscessus subsp. abscessus]